MHVVEMESKLAADASGELRNELCAGLTEDRRGARQRIDAGLPPDDYRVAQAFQDACAAAERVVHEFWRRSHQPSRLGAILK